MLAIAGQTAVPNGLKCFDETHGYPGPGGNRLKKIEFFFFFKSHSFKNPDFF